MKKINLLVPDLPESISDATVVKWHKKIGDKVNCDDNIVDIETDKVMLEVSSPCDGILRLIIEEEGKIVKSQQILGEIDKLDMIQNDLSSNNIKEKEKKVSNTKKHSITQEKKIEYSLQNNIEYLTPSVRRLININQNSLKKIIEKNNKVNLENIIKTEEKKINKSILSQSSVDISEKHEKENEKFEKRVKMTRLRQRIAERLLESKNNTAMLTTFNEVNMKPIMLLREKYGEDFKKKHGVKIGFMSFFVKAVVQGLKNFPEINAYIDKTDIVFYNNFDISIAISTPRGLITPVLKNTDKMTMSQIEKKIKEFSIKGFQNKINIKELIGGNFTITNGGVFGSLMSTPIINPPQTAILGMHMIQERPVALNGKVEILPMMYIALSYDHRLIDGKESVGFLVNIKNILEDFTRILIDI
ncbi:dihydrolipoyllysine-residue succinyltransferase [Buchnera aphidicola (Acyrthosiphon lactucae)]|uniref:Dihydrolipoyllysine-residue succinyltransferase n=1 Tax=Buchnera aphidicola (Acyrthosiphon lactucae) TaxID=1241832 RepID=A0A4D6XQ27_9GAMM|nr:dihydrolipoyllysine-residue succinyltransferase [Buchnera aphidicola]QCI17699.1 dihydrolipoyllysine-residue succinyltransferase [Buchnera aphidicola (Acyrthosiphon lactucae)]